MSIMDYIVRDATGGVRNGAFPDGETSTIDVSNIKDISLHLGPADVRAYRQSGDNLVIRLDKGQVLVLRGFFDESTTGEKGLFLSQDGNFIEAVLADGQDGSIQAIYQSVDVSGKWSAYDDLVFLDLGRIEPVVAPLVAPLLGGLGGVAATGAAIAVGTQVLGDGGGGPGGGGGGGAGGIVPTVDDADATRLVGGSAAGSASITGTGAPGSKVIVTIGDKSQTVIVGGDGTWSATFKSQDLPADGVYGAIVSVTGPDGTVHDLTGPTMDIDTAAPDVAVTGGSGAGGVLVNAEAHETGVTITGTGEPGASITVEIQGTTHTATVDENGDWSVDFATGEIRVGDYDGEISITSTDARGNSTSVTEVLSVDTVAPGADLDAVEGDGIVNATESSDGITLTGSGEVGSTISVRFQGVTRTTTVDEDGAWSMDFAATEITSGTYDSTVRITSTDAAGNVTRSQHTVRIDTEMASSLNTQVGTDDIINATEHGDGVTFNGTSEPGASVVVTMGSVSHTVTAGADGTWSATFVTAEIPEGTYDATVTAVATDAAGNTHTSSGTVAVNTESVVALDTTQVGDNVIDASEATGDITLTGTTDPGSTVDVTIEGVTETATVDEDGNWSVVFAPDDIPAGEYDADVTVTSTDTTGNTATATGMVRIDTETSVDLDTVAGDDIIDPGEATGGITLSGTAEAGSTVVVALGAVSHTVTTDGNGNWSSAFTTAEIAPGEYDAPVTVTATDAVGNTSTTSATVRVDTATSVGLNAAQAGGDGILNATETATGLTLTGTAEGGATVDVTFQGVTRSVTADASGDWSAAFTAGEITPGEYDAPVTITSTDAVGNTATTTGTVAVDTSTSVTVAPDGAGGDNVVNQSEAGTGVTFTGAAEPGSSVEVTVAGVTSTATVDAAGNWSAAFGAGVIAAGEYDTNVTVNATDAAGNTATSTSAVRVDTVAGTVTLSPLPIEIDDVINAAERADGVPVSGTATPGMTVTVALGGATQQVVADAIGEWTVTFPAQDIATGTSTLPVTATISDAAGNTSSVTDSVNLDTMVDALALNAAAIEGDDVVSAAEHADGVSLTGTVEPGSSVMAQLGTASQAATVDAAGNWSVTFPAASIPTGSYDADIVVTATDAAGNSDVIRDAVRIDTVAEVSVDANQTADDIINAVERVNGITLVGTTEPGSAVAVRFQGVSRAATVDAAGNWSAAFSAAEVPAGTYAASATITATDAVGNVTTLSETVNVDTEVANPNVDSVTFVGSEVWRIGTQEVLDSYSVNTLDSNGTVATPASTQSTHPFFGTEFIFDAAIPDGTNLIVTREDGAGNQSSTMVVLEDGAGNATTVDNAGLSGFDIQKLNLDYGADTGLVLTEAQIKALSNSSDTLTVQGGADDSVTVAGAVSTGEVRQINGQSFDVYTIGDDGTTLVIEQDIQVII